MASNGHDIQAFARRTDRDVTSRFASLFPQDMKTDSLSPSIGTVRALKELIYSSESKKQLENLLDQFRPDIVHAHNIYGRLTTSVLDLLKEESIPIVLTLHDYKLVCPSYKLMHGNRICEDCKGRHFFHAVLNRCHKDSVLASSVYALESWFNTFFDKYRSNVKYFISPSRFMKNKLVEFGFPEQQIIYLPNFIDTPKFFPKYNAGDYLLYIGRLSLEKGIETLIRAFKQTSGTNLRLLVAGDGPERQNLLAIAKEDSRVQFTGYLSGIDLSNVIQNAKAVVVPSQWYENAPLSVLEAFAYGKPVIGAKIGGIPEMIADGENGLLFDPGNVDDLSSKINNLLDKSANEIISMGMAARKKVEDQYSAEAHYRQLIEIYKMAKSCHHSIHQ